MDRQLDFVGTALAVLGMLVCVVTVLTRLSGSFYLAGFELGPVLLGGIVLLLVAVLAKLQVLLWRSSR